MSDAAGEPSFPGEPDAYAWTAEAAEWVPVGDGWGYHKEVEILQAVLLDARIPARLSEHPFASLIGYLYGTDRPPYILVPPSCVREASEILSATPAPESSADVAEEIAEAREADTRGQWTMAVLRVYTGLYVSLVVAEFVGLAIRLVQLLMGR